jgi:hypothetical protein
MTTPAERSRAALYAHAFLEDLLNKRVTPRVPPKVRDVARGLLRHFPDAFAIERAHEGAPDWWGPLPDQPPWQPKPQELAKDLLSRKEHKK